MVHLHGGSNTFGSGYEDASAFVSRGVIVVTLNYRLGALGFVGHPALSAEGGGSSGEYGVLDQLAALRWVHDNIAAFGGDPANVTLFGFSAGSFDTVALMASPLAAGLITRAAVQGEAYWGLTGYNTQIADAESIGSGIAGGLGCGTATNVPACLRALPAEEIVREAGAMDVVPWVGGAVLPRSPLELVAERFQGIPLLVGFDREEDSIFEWQYLADPFTNQNWVHTTSLLVGPSLAAKARALYPTNQYESSKWAYIAMVTDAKRGCPTRRLANANVAHAATYRYLYTHVLENDPFYAQFKAFHGAEDALLWRQELLHTHAERAAPLTADDRLLDELRQDGQPERPRPALLAPIRPGDRAGRTARQPDRAHPPLPRRTMRAARHVPPVLVRPGLQQRTQDRPVRLLALTARYRSLISVLAPRHISVPVTTIASGRARSLVCNARTRARQGG